MHLFGIRSRVIEGFKTTKITLDLGDCVAKVSTSVITFIVIGLVVGAAIGWVAKPIPLPGPEWIQKTEYDKLQANYNTALAQLAKLKKAQKVGLILATGGLGDKSFNDISYAGVVKAKEELGIEFSYVEPKAIAEYEGFQRNYAKTGEYAIIICVGFDQADALTKVATEYPNQKFAIVDMVVDKPNVASLLFKANEGSFLVGVIAGMMTKTGKVGFVGGMDIPLIRDFFLGYEAGAKWANKTATILAPVFVGEWANPTKGKELALSLIQLGADAIYVAAGKSGLGALAAVNEKKIMGFGVDACQCYLYPEVIASMTKRVDTAVFEMVVAAVLAKAYPFLPTPFKGGIYEKGVKDGWTGTCRLPEEEAFWETKFNFKHKALSTTVVAKLKEARDKIVSGEVKVPRPEGW